MKFRIKDENTEHAPRTADSPDTESACSGDKEHKDRLGRVKRALDALLDRVESGGLEEKEQASVLNQASMILSRLVPLERELDQNNAQGNPELLSDEQLDAQIQQYLGEIHLTPAAQGKSKKNPT